MRFVKDRNRVGEGAPLPCNVLHGPLGWNWSGTTGGCVALAGAAAVAAVGRAGRADRRGLGGDAPAGSTTRTTTGARFWSTWAWSCWPEVRRSGTLSEPSTNPGPHSSCATQRLPPARRSSGAGPVPAAHRRRPAVQSSPARIRKRRIQPSQGPHLPGTRSRQEIQRPCT